MGFDLFLYHTICCMIDVIKEYLVLRYVIGFMPKRKPVFLFFMFLIIPIGMAVAGRFLPAKYLSVMYLPLILIVMRVVVGIRYVKSFLMSIITFVCICELDFFVAAFLQLLPEGATYITLDNMRASAVSLLVIFLVAAACKYYDVTFYKKNMKHRKAFVALEIFVLFINLGIMGTFFGMLSESSAGSYGNLMLIMVIILSMLLSVITLIFYTAIMNVKEYRVLHEMNQKQLQLQKKYYEQLREIDRETRKFRHDLKNHFFVLSGFLQEDKQDQAKQYLKEMIGQFSEVQKIIQTGNDIIDAILNEKFQECKKKNISMKVEGIIYASLLISDYDICTILVNAMDNAVEACERVLSDNKWITVSIGTYQEYLHLVISNSSTENVNLRTKKADRRNHGLGLENLQECVEKNQGKVSVMTEGGRFVLDILVKVVEESEN